jgi:phosphosulfolactate synthase
MFVDKLNTPRRTNKPRENGLTSIHDIGLTTRVLEMILKDYSEYLDIAKLGVGTAAISPNLEEKISLYQNFGVKVYFGGTLFEKFCYQDKLKELKGILSELSIDYVEISAGTIDLTLSTRKSLVSYFKESGLDVLCEVGSKDKEKVMPPRQWIEEIQSLLESGAKYIITEGRNSGTVGIFRPSGELRTGLVDDIVYNIDSSKLIFEAPTNTSQMFLINLIGSNVNLGNVNPNDLLLLEAQRLGLRSETFMINNT